MRICKLVRKSWLGKKEFLIPFLTMLQLKVTVGKSLFLSIIILSNSISGYLLFVSYDVPALIVA